MSEQLYVCGFLFNSKRNAVVLIKKNKPKWQKGKYNGIGGKVEIGEHSDMAMRREAKEEIGIDTNWIPAFTYCYREEAVVFFYVRYNDELFYGSSAKEEESILKPSIYAVIDGKIPVIGNLRWMVPFLAEIQNTSNPTFTTFDDVEF